MSESNGNTKKPSDLAKSLRELPSRLVNLDNIVCNYDTAIVNKDSCSPAIILLWQPLKLIECEIAYRISFLNNLTALKNYNDFDDISESFQQKARSLMTPVKVKIFSLDMN